MADVENLSSKAQLLWENEQIEWVFEDVRDRIMGGDVDEFEDAVELILEELESHAEVVVDHDDNQEFGDPCDTDDERDSREDPDVDVDDARDLDPDAPEDTDDPDADLEELAEELAAHVWQNCREIAQAWDDETTDADRVLTAFSALQERRIAVGMFTDWADIEPRERGGVLVWVNDWENLSHEEQRPLRIGYVAYDEATDAEIASDLVAALRDAGLEPSEPAEGSVTVPVLWRWHVESLDA